MTNKSILDNAPAGATHYAEGLNYIAMNTKGNWMRYDPNGLNGGAWFNADDYKFIYVKDFRSLADVESLVKLGVSDDL